MALPACFIRPDGPMASSVAEDAAMDTSDACAPVWTAPVLVQSLNAMATDDNPSLRPTGDVLVFQTARGGAGADLYFSQLSSGAYSPPVIGYSSGAQETVPVWSGDGTRVYFNVAGSDYVGVFDLPSLKIVGAAMATEFQTGHSVVHSTFTANDLVMVYSDGNQLHQAERAVTSESFSSARNTVLSALNSGAIEQSPSMTPDGRTIYFISHRTGSARVFVATRASVAATYFTSPQPIDVLGEDILSVSVSASGDTLFISKDNGAQNEDIYTSRLACQ